MALRSALVSTLAAWAMLALACGGPRDRPTGGRQPGPMLDAAARDAPDADLPASDTGVEDVGAGPDAGAHVDGGEPIDAGPPLDAGEPADAAPPVDAGAPPPPSGAFLYTGAGGGGPSTDLRVGSVAGVYRDTGVTVSSDSSLPSDFSQRFGLLALMNPRRGIPEEVVDAARALLSRGGRVLVVMEHCKDGCWGNASANNAFIAALGGTMELRRGGGAPLRATSLSLTPAPPLTDGVTRLVVYYSASLDPGQGVEIGRVGNDTVVAYESVGGGQIVVVADSSMFGYVLSSGDNRTFITNLALF